MEFLGITIEYEDYEKLGKMVAIEAQIEKIKDSVVAIDFSNRAELMATKLKDIEIIIKAALPLIQEFKEVQQ